MSRAKVINKSAFQRAYKAIQNNINAIRSAGFPQEIADMSIPGFGIGVTPPLSADMPNQIGWVMCSDSPVPLYLTEYMQGDTVFPLPENLLPVSKIKDAKPTPIATHHTVQAPESKTDLVRVAEQDLESSNMAKQLPQVQAKEDIHQESEVNDVMLTNAVLASLKENGLQTKTAEAISPNVTKITLEDVLADRRIRIPEYVMVRRKS